MDFNWPTPELTVSDRVGIGTDTPSRELDVIGDISATNLNLNGSLTINQNLTVGGNFQLGTLAVNEISSDGNLADNSNLALPTEQAVKTYVDNQLTLVNNSLDTKASLNGASDQDFTAQNLTVGGNVGIGTTTPEAKLDIIPSGSQPWLKMGSGGDSGRLWVEYGSNNAPLLVLSDLDDLPRIRFQQIGTQTEANPQFQSWIGLAQSLSSDLAIMGGNVGIGTTNPSQKLEVSGNVKISGDVQLPNSDGGLATLTPDKYNNESSFKKNNVKLSLGSTSVLTPIGQSPLEYEFAVGHTFSQLFINPGGVFEWSTNFVKRFSVNQDGDAYFAGSKGGYVVDYFVNRVGDTLEQGDVVIISEHQVSHYSGSQNNIPIPEVDLTDIAYNSRVCGIVAKVTTEKDLPYVEAESPTQPEMQPEEIAKLEVSDIEVLHPLRALATESKADLDLTKIPDQQMGTMVTLGAFAHCKVDADIAPIQVGDLLTTSSTRGHAQKVLELERTTGAIIGKALKSLEKGKGKIPVLVMLQ